MKNYLNRSKLYTIAGFIIFIGFFASKANAQIVQASSVNEIRKYTSRYNDEGTLVSPDMPNFVNELNSRKMTVIEFTSNSSIQVTSK